MKRACYHPRAKRGIAALIEIVVVAALILGGMALYFGLMGGGKGRGGELMDPTGTTTAMDIQHDLAEKQAPIGQAADGAKAPENTGTTGNTSSSSKSGGSTSVITPSSVPGKAMYKARGEQCMQNLRQLRMMIQMSTDDGGGTFPGSLTDVDGSIQVRTCPISDQDYTYDPTTGKVYCTAPGHENF